MCSQLRIQRFHVGSLKSGMVEVSVFATWKWANVTIESNFFSLLLFLVVCFFAVFQPNFVCPLDECAEEYFSTFLKLNRQPSKWQLTSMNLGRPMNHGEQQCECPTL